MCTRTTFTAADGRVITGRNMDWPEDMHTDLWAFAAGMARTGENTNPFSWESHHATLVASVYNLATCDGINDAGFVANLLYLSESDVGHPGDRVRLSVAAWAQYLLDCCATVSEAVTTMEQAPFALTAPALPNGSAGTVHLSVSDAGGDSAIFEFVDGDLKVHHGPEYRVMTNSPTYDQQLAIDAYWQEIGGEVMLPGTSRAADRYVWASYYLSQLPRNVDARTAAAGVLSVQRNASKPIARSVVGADDVGRPEVSQTLWTTVCDAAALRYFFQDTLSPDIFWVDLDKLDFQANPPCRRLDLQDHPMIHGEVSAQFVAAEPFAFLGS